MDGGPPVDGAATVAERARQLLVSGGGGDLERVTQTGCGLALAEVLARAFFRSRADSQFVLPKVGLSELYTDDARRYIEARGGRVELKSSVTDVVVTGGRVVALGLRDGARFEAEACISAVPPKALTSLLPDAFRNGGGLPARYALACDAFETSPIVSVHLWFDRPVLAHAFVGLIGTTTQWLFNRNQLTGNGDNGAGRQCLSAVISAGRDLVDWPTAQIVATVLADLRTMLPAARAAHLLQSVVVKEKHAPISATPAAERLRPAATTPIGNFFLAGDWTSTGLPPTIESAVYSGRRAAELVAEYLGASSTIQLEPQAFAGTATLGALNFAHLNPVSFFKPRFVRSPSQRANGERSRRTSGSRPCLVA